MINSRAVGLFLSHWCIAWNTEAASSCRSAFPEGCPSGVSFPQPCPDLHCNVPASVPHPSFPNRDGHPVQSAQSVLQFSRCFLFKRLFHIIRLFHSDVQIHQPVSVHFSRRSHICLFQLTGSWSPFCEMPRNNAMIICSITIHRDGNRFYGMFQYLRPSGRIQHSGWPLCQR